MNLSNPGFPHFIRPLLFLLLFLAASLPLTAGETGYASWYGGKFQGRKTASGEIFDTAGLTAAHRTLAFGTMVRVVNLENGREITVRINDRGPFVEGRIIDLSQAAAQALEMVGQGVARVSVEVISSPAQAALEHRIVPEEGQVIIQVGSYSSRTNALEASRKLSAAGLEPRLEEAARGFTRVILGNIPEDQVDPLLRKLSDLGYSAPLIRRTR